MPTAAKASAAPKKSIKAPPGSTNKGAPAKLAQTQRAASSKGVDVGSKVPVFKSDKVTVLGSVSSSELRGKPFLIYFYPKDDTSGCTAQACAFEEALPKLTKLGIQVIGVSKDSIASHEKFAKKYNLSFPLISDEDVSIASAFDVWKQKSMYGRTYMGTERSTFLVDGQGVIRAVWRKVSVPGHADEVRKAISDL